MLRTCLRRLGRLAENVEPLWVGGLAILQMVLLRRFGNLEGEKYTWWQFLLLGTAFPTQLFALLVVGRRLAASPAARAGRLALAGYCVFACAALCLSEAQA